MVCLIHRGFLKHKLGEQSSSCAPLASSTASMVFLIHHTATLKVLGGLEPRMELMVVHMLMGGCMMVSSVHHMLSRSHMEFLLAQLVYSHFEDIVSRHPESQFRIEKLTLGHNLQILQPWQCQPM
jgi:hypothetical protein